jgi:hypothetical protein
MPNMYARGIVFGKMVLELGDTCVAQKTSTDMLADLDFKTKVNCDYCKLLFASNDDWRRVSFQVLITPSPER